MTMVQTYLWQRPLTELVAVARNTADQLTISGQRLYPLQALQRAASEARERRTAKRISERVPVCDAYSVLK